MGVLMLKCCASGTGCAARLAEAGRKGMVLDARGYRLDGAHKALRLFANDEIMSRIMHVRQR
jgi:hypothetical protein